jgi:hypothetical protein
MSDDLRVLYWDFLDSYHPSRIEVKQTKDGIKIWACWEDDFNNRWNATYELLYDFTRNFRLE